ncbi:mCG146054, partial [Mus musculus]
GSSSDVWGMETDGPSRGETVLTSDVSRNRDAMVWIGWMSCTVPKEQRQCLQAENSEMVTRSPGSSQMVCHRAGKRTQHQR